MLCYYIGGCSLRNDDGTCKQNGCSLNDIARDNPKNFLNIPNDIRRKELERMKFNVDRMEGCPNYIWKELEKIRFGVDSMEGANSTPLDGCFFPKNRNIKERLIKILTTWNPSRIDEELKFYDIKVNWKLLESYFSTKLNEVII